MIFMGVMMFTGWMNDVTGYLSSLTPSQGNTAATEKTTFGSEQTESSAAESAESDADKTMEALGFTLTDQYGEVHTLSDYKGKTVFLNFWATWCPPCRAEMPDIQKLYEEYGNNEEDLIILGIAAPNLGREGDEDSIKSFLKENGYTYPVVMDPVGEIFNIYGITAFPTTFMIDKEGNIFGYVPGQLTEDVMESIIKQTMEDKRADN